MEMQKSKCTQSFRGRSALNLHIWSPFGICVSLFTDVIMFPAHSVQCNVCFRSGFVIYLRNTSLTGLLICTSLPARALPPSDLFFQSRIVSTATMSDTRNTTSVSRTLPNICSCLPHTQMVTLTRWVALLLTHIVIHDVCLSVYHAWSLT